MGKFEELKKELFMNGQEAIENFLGFEIDYDTEKDVIDSMIDEVAEQMPDEELEEYYNLYL